MHPNWRSDPNNRDRYPGRPLPVESDVFAEYAQGDQPTYMGHGNLGHSSARGTLLAMASWESRERTHEPRVSSSPRPPQSPSITYYSANMDSNMEFDRPSRPNSTPRSNNPRHIRPAVDDRIYEVTAKPIEFHHPHAKPKIYHGTSTINPQTVSTILSERLFENRYVVDKEDLPFKEDNFHWREKGLTRVGHVLDRCGAIRWDQILVKFDKSVHEVAKVQVKTILDGIPISWLRILEENGKAQSRKLIDSPF
eukprot:c17468_g1_i3.p1 GENE.c17468_g1_i3~~c17468_g1_i3.p1  ORF type:complete len:252 (-),score=27.27 c17468_g1_i3:17-772(-)